MEIGGVRLRSLSEKILAEELKSWGIFREDKVAIEKIAQLSIEAQKIIDKVGW